MSINERSDLRSVLDLCGASVLPERIVLTVWRGGLHKESTDHFDSDALLVLLSGSSAN